MTGKGYALLTALALIGGLIGGAASDRFFTNMRSSVKTKKIQIADQEGKTRIELSTLPDGSPGVILADENGKVRVMLAIWGSPISYRRYPSTNKDGRQADRDDYAVSRPDGIPYIAFADTNKNIIWTAP